jgi:tRNA threonylcarbamoyladenosine biosynthesis protein TsaB
MTPRALLALDGAVPGGTIAIVRDGALAAETEVVGRHTGEDRFMPAIDDALRRAGLRLGQLDALVCGQGPGSFTGLRIAASIAKGIAFARGLPLYAVSSFALLAASIEPPLFPGRYIATLDAMRSECFVAAVEIDASLTPRVLDADAIVARDDVWRLAEERVARVIGSAGAIAAAPHARGVVRLLSAVWASAPVDLIAWEPHYGRLAEAQARWERASGKPLTADA